jgi:hypothetical protein
MITSKSPRKVALIALAAGKQAFSDYSHKFSPHKLTQPQLFACLVLKEFENKDYRGIANFCRTGRTCVVRWACISCRTTPPCKRPAEGC